ncbi:hypothetical protein PMI11_03402 [Rhizobium sp. CF142]|nr:hypothetical protein PMI11_03402 [Rhizobium sp. CF142]
MPRLAGPSHGSWRSTLDPIHWIDCCRFVLPDLTPR